MPINTPEWLSKRDAQLRASSDGKSWLVYFGNELTYLVALTPAKGKFTAKVMQTINGKTLPPCPGEKENPEEAAQAGLESLRAFLGW